MRNVCVCVTSLWLFAGTLVLGGEVGAQDAGNSPPVMTKRQSINECMTKQMAANKALSYNSASKECTARVKSQTSAATPSIHAKK